MERDSDQMIANSIAIVDREEKTNRNDKTVRTYTVGKGGLPGTLTISGDASNSNPINPEITFTFEKVRSYRIVQPSSDTEIVFQSTDSSDTSINIDIEDEGASTTETVTLDSSDGTTLVSTSSTFSDIDAIQLASETTGNVEVYENDGSVASPTKGTQLTTIYGQDEYQNVGDLGVPTLGSGSHNADSLTGEFIRFHGSTLQQPDGTDVALEMQSAELNIENNLEQTPRVDDIVQAVFPGVRDSSLTATVYGERESHDHIMESLRNTSDNLIWDLKGAGEIQLDNARKTDPPSRTVEGTQATMSLDVGFSGEGVTLSKP